MPPMKKSSSRRKRAFQVVLFAGLLVGTIRLLVPLEAHPNRPGVLYWRGSPDEKKIALTFDDGPNEPYTSEVLDILRTNGVHATFFLTGKNIEVFPDAARAIVREGHAVGNHSYSHRSMLLETNRTVRRELDKTEALIEAVTGRRTNLFRPPYGGKDFLTLNESRKKGYVMVEWTVSAQDWRRPGVLRIVKRVLRGARNGAIVLMHDGDEWRHGSDRSQTVASLPILIRELRKEGYEFVTVPELLKLNSDSSS
jgi:peptidoglycan-N-acetylglucosamine deacetylase